MDDEKGAEELSVRNPGKWSPAAGRANTHGSLSANLKE